MRHSKKAFHLMCACVSLAVCLSNTVGSEQWYHLKSSLKNDRDTLLDSRHIVDIALINGNHRGEAAILVSTEKNGMCIFSHDAYPSAVFQVYPDSLINWNSWKRFSPSELGDLSIRSLVTIEDTMFMGSNKEGVIRGLKTDYTNSPDFSLTLYSNGLPPSFTLGHYNPIDRLGCTGNTIFALVQGELYSATFNDGVWQKQPVAIHEGYPVSSFHAAGNVVCCWVPNRESIHTFRISNDGGETWNTFFADELIGLSSDSILGYPKTIHCTSRNTILIAFHIKDMQSKHNQSDRIVFLRSSDAGRTWNKLTTVIHGNPHISLTELNDRLFMSLHNSDRKNSRIVPSDWKAGVYVSDDNGDVWTPFATGLTDTLVHLVKVSNERVVAATLNGNVFLHDPGLMHYWENRPGVKTKVKPGFTRLKQSVNRNNFVFLSSPGTENIFRRNGRDRMILDLQGRIVNGRFRTGSASKPPLSSRFYLVP